MGLATLFSSRRFFGSSKQELTNVAPALTFADHLRHSALSDAVSLVERKLDDDEFDRALCREVIIQLFCKAITAPDLQIQELNRMLKLFARVSYTIDLEGMGFLVTSLLHREFYYHRCQEIYLNWIADGGDLVARLLRPIDELLHLIEEQGDYLLLDRSELRETALTTAAKAMAQDIERVVLGRQGQLFALKKGPLHDLLEALQEALAELHHRLGRHETTVHPHTPSPLLSLLKP